MNEPSSLRTSQVQAETSYLVKKWMVVPVPAVIGFMLSACHSWKQRYLVTAFQADFLFSMENQLVVY